VIPGKQPGIPSPTQFARHVAALSGGARFRQSHPNKTDHQVTDYSTRIVLFHKEMRHVFPATVRRHSDNGYLINKLLTSGSWLEVMSCDVLLLMSGHADAANVELLRLYKSDRSGPLCFLAASYLVGQQNPVLTRMMAARGLRRLALDDFHKDCTQLLDPKSPLGQFALRLVEFLREADDGDIPSLVALLPEERAKQFRPVIDLLRQNRKQPIEQTLRAVLDAVWQNGLREHVEIMLESLEKAAKPNIEQSNYRRSPSTVHQPS
jgi:hypothetical protein